VEGVVGDILEAAREIVQDLTRILQDTALEHQCLWAWLMKATAVVHYQEGKFRMGLSPHSAVTAENLFGKNVTSIPSIG
jgi:hypothetical protein